jgi:hypothetical protein
MHTGFNPSTSGYIQQHLQDCGPIHNDCDGGRCVKALRESRVPFERPDTPATISSVAASLPVDFFAF